MEIDGKYHLAEAGKQQDERRDAFLRNSGFKILRVAGFRVTQDRAGVRKEIEQAIEYCRREHTYPPPHHLPLSPTKCGEEGRLDELGGWLSEKVATNRISINETTTQAQRLSGPV